MLSASAISIGPLFLPLASVSSSAFSRSNCRAASGVTRKPLVTSLASAGFGFLAEAAAREAGFSILTWNFDRSAALAMALSFRKLLDDPFPGSGDLGGGLAAGLQLGHRT